MLTNHARIEEVFSAASEQVLSGRTIESVISDYPEYASELEPMLRLTHAIHTMPGPSLSPAALSSIHRRAEAAAEERRSGFQAQRQGTRSYPPREVARAGRQSWLASLLSVLRTNVKIAVPLLAVLAVLIVGTFLLSNQHPQTQLVSYSGTITQILPTGWQVGDTEVLIDSHTVIHGTAVVGAEMVCVGEDLPEKDRMYASEVWVGIEPSPPLTVPTRVHDEGFVVRERQS